MRLALILALLLSSGSPALAQDTPTTLKDPLPVQTRDVQPPLHSFDGFRGTRKLDGHVYYDYDLMNGEVCDT